MDDRITTISLDENLNLVKPGKGIVNINITPGLIATLGVLGLAIWILFSVGGALSQRDAEEGRPAGSNAAEASAMWLLFPPAGMAKAAGWI